jgi:hypothetical protein
MSPVGPLQRQFGNGKFFRENDASWCKGLPFYVRSQNLEILESSAPKMGLLLSKKNFTSLGENGQNATTRSRTKQNFEGKLMG